MTWIRSGTPAEGATATGIAQLVRDPAAIARYQRELEPWAASGDMDYVIAVEPQMITGLRISVPTAG